MTITKKGRFTDTDHYQALATLRDEVKPGDRSGPSCGTSRRAA